MPSIEPSPPMRQIDLPSYHINMSEITYRPLYHFTGISRPSYRGGLIQPDGKYRYDSFPISFVLFVQYTGVFMVC